ncbi:META domain-containing protein [Agromyces arachidis]|uniref:META domain-containing protein n=1 Tax=Agromyces arachidis TaxID=766966 RepID=UPI0040570DE7
MMASTSSWVDWRLAPVAAGVFMLLSGCSAPDHPDPTQTPDQSEVFVGAWGSSLSDGVGIQFYEDGRFEAHDVCLLSGEWSEVDGRIELVVSAGTGMACADVPNLGQMREAEVRSGKLTLLDNDGRALVQLDRLDD